MSADSQIQEIRDVRDQLSEELLVLPEDQWETFLDQQTNLTAPDALEAREGATGTSESCFREHSEKILAVMHRAAERARRVAVQTNTPLVLVRDGKVVHVSPDGSEGEVAS
jgi:hypothetical protein